MQKTAIPENTPPVFPITGTASVKKFLIEKCQNTTYNQRHKVKIEITKDWRTSVISFETLRPVDSASYSLTAEDKSSNHTLFLKVNGSPQIPFQLWAAFNFPETNSVYLRDNIKGNCLKILSSELIASNPTT